PRIGTLCAQAARSLSTGSASSLTLQSRRASGRFARTTVLCQQYAPARRRQCMRIKRLRLLVALLGSIVTDPLTAPAVAAKLESPGGRKDADIVMVLPAIERTTFHEERNALQPLLKELRHQHLKYALVPLSSILHNSPPESLTAEDVRAYLRTTYKWRPSTETAPRYLAIFSAPTPGYLTTPSTLPVIPRFHIDAGGVDFDSDVPY